MLNQGWLSPQKTNKLKGDGFKSLDLILDEFHLILGKPLQKKKQDSNARKKKKWQEIQ